MSMLEIFLSKNDLEHIANGHDLKIRGSRVSKVDGIILKPDLVNDTRNLLINYKYKLINTEQQNFANNFSGGAIRAWDKLRKRISVVDRIYFDTEGVQLRDDGGLYWRHFREVILMQSTGILDKNSQEIFEGDILEIQGIRMVVKFGSYEYIESSKSNGHMIGVVYDGLGFYVECINAADPDRISPFEPKTLKESAVIGNEFENPELLEVKE